MTALGGAEPPLPVEEILAAFAGVESLAGGRAGALRTVVVTGGQSVQVLAPVPLDAASGVLYLRLVRSRANVASTLRAIEGLGVDPPRGALISIGNLAYTTLKLFGET
ncbi:hypothetical protein, partial [Pseudonocardia pini]|uniref:hypothetical protein n=1 Tax=Pseudonocardia pini TaxID=2758030 RepID=UPI0015EFE858